MLLANILSLGLVIAFVVGIFKSDLSPWWFWPAGVVVIVVCWLMGTCMAVLAEQKMETGASREAM